MQADADPPSSLLQNCHSAFTVLLLFNVFSSPLKQPPLHFLIIIFRYVIGKISLVSHIIVLQTHAGLINSHFSKDPLFFPGLLLLMPYSPPSCTLPRMLFSHLYLNKHARFFTFSPLAAPTHLERMIFREPFYYLHHSFSQQAGMQAPRTR